MTFHSALRFRRGRPDAQDSTRVRAFGATSPDSRPPRRDRRPNTGFFAFANLESLLGATEGQETREPRTTGSRFPTRRRRTARRARPARAEPPRTRATLTDPVASAPRSNDLIALRTRDGRLARCFASKKKRVELLAAGRTRPNGAHAHLDPRAVATGPAASSSKSAGERLVLQLFRRPFLLEEAAAAARAQGANAKIAPPRFRASTPSSASTSRPPRLCPRTR